jgi:TRAP-type C4-dicarboxylate transport system permease small subunit
MGNWLHYIDRVIASISRVMSGIAATAVILMMLLITVDVLLRYFLNRPIKGAHELIEFMMILAVFLGVAYVQYRKVNISISLLLDRLPQKAQAIISSLTYILSLGIICVITWTAFTYFRRLWDRGQCTTVLNVPIAPLEFILAGSLLMLCIVLTLDFLHSISKQVG